MSVPEMTDDGLQWFATADLSGYEGKYVALAGKKVVADGEDPGEVFAAATRAHPDQKVVLWKVPREGFCVFVMGASRRR